MTTSTTLGGSWNARANDGGTLCTFCFISLHFISSHLIARGRFGLVRSRARTTTRRKKTRRSRANDRARHRFIHACISSIHACMHACMHACVHNHIPSIFRARTSRVSRPPSRERARTSFAIRREEGRVESSRLQKLSRASGDRHARLGDGKKVFNQQYSAISQDFTSTDITPCAKMPRAGRPGDAFVPIVCARARVHGYGCVCD